MTLTPEDIAAGWVEWGGGPTPVKANDLVTMQFKGTAPKACKPMLGCNILPGLWEHDPDMRSHWRITAYRIVQPAPENGSE